MSEETRVEFSPKQETWVIDATMAGETEDEMGLYPFCPVNVETGQVMVGMTLLSDSPPEGARCVGAFHGDGQAAAEKWCEDHRDLMDGLCGAAS